MADELLELARTAAHKHERWYAPLTCYLAGVAIGRMESQQGALDPATAASILIGVNAQLNPAP
ncbi:MAG TPA: DUF6457 domain-containing protein [Candidatus Dormibacteraeota bacterium]|nr:DUF6457 domain-containing protein [Candidatus Dormibacteraeota bacterium]